MEDEIAAWLREQAEADLRRAEKTAGVFMDNPRTGAARAESVLAVLDDYAATLAVKERCEAKLRAGGELPPDSDYLDALPELSVYESVARELAYGYRHRGGF